MIPRPAPLIWQADMSTWRFLTHMMEIIWDSEENYQMQSDKKQSLQKHIFNIQESPASTDNKYWE